MTRYERPLAKLWDLWEPRARLGIHPFDHTLYKDNERVIHSLISYDRDLWAQAYSDVAAGYERKGNDAEEAGDPNAARSNYFLAYGNYRMARFPTTNSQGKKQAYRKSQELFLKAARYFEVPVERVEIPFSGRAGEGRQIVAYLRVPRASTPRPVLLVSGGIDTFKEDSYEDDVLQTGVSTLSIDIPGVGDAPLKGSTDAERLFDPILDWIEGRPDLDAGRVGYWGSSTGGYWAVKVAHTHRIRLAFVISQGGCTHYAFKPDWIEKAQWSDYPFELAETLAFAFGLSTFEEWVEFAPQLSLLNQGILDQLCAPLLLINGIHDSVFPIQDYQLLLEHGSPKCVRFFDAPHMGYTRDTRKIILEWIDERVRARR